MVAIGKNTSARVANAPVVAASGRKERRLTKVKSPSAILRVHIILGLAMLACILPTLLVTKDVTSQRRTDELSLLSLPSNNTSSETKKRLPKTHEIKMKDETSSGIQRIYYINLEKAKKRRSLMKWWLGKQSIPFQRINATVGTDDPSACIPRKQQVENCRKITGLMMTELDIIRNHNTSGLTLLFEDDFLVHRPLDQVVNLTLALVPPDWDIIRWDCWSYKSIKRGQAFKTQKVFRTVCDYDVEPECKFCGGTYAMMWRGSSVHKLEKVWSQRPFDDVDCRLTTDELKSYCVNIGIGSLVSAK